MSKILKYLPYILIIIVGIAIYCGFKYMSNQIANEREKTTLLQIKNAELLNNIKMKENVAQITFEQMKQIELNTLEALNNNLDSNNKIESFKLNGERKNMLDKINNYEICMSKNSLNPFIKCDLDI